MEHRSRESTPHSPRERRDFRRQRADPAALRLGHRVLHRALEAPLHGSVGGHAELVHAVDRVAPRVELLKAARAEHAEPDHMVTDLVQEDREPQRTRRIRRFDRALLMTVAKDPQRREAGERTPPATHAQAVRGEKPLDDRVVPLLHGAAVCGGGRYDYLIREIGGKPAPAVGWALGVERVLELLKEQGNASPEVTPDAYAVVSDADALPLVTPVLQSLRQMGVSVQMHSPADSSGGMGSMKSQFKKADASGASYALIFGADELAQQQVTIKALRDGTGAQRTESLLKTAEWGHSLQSSL